MDTTDASQQFSSAHSPSATTILVAENEESNRVLMQQMLVLGGYECILTANGREAVEALQQRHVDLALLDLSMPVLDGYRAVALIRRLPGGASLPIVAVTGHGSVADRELALRSGFTDYLTKPFTQRTLLSLVARLLGETKSS